MLPIKLLLTFYKQFTIYPGCMGIINPHPSLLVCLIHGWWFKKKTCKPHFRWHFMPPSLHCRSSLPEWGISYWRDRGWNCNLSPYTTVLCILRCSCLFEQSWLPTTLRFVCFVVFISYLSYTVKTGVLKMTPVGVNIGPHPQVLKLHPRV